MALMVQIAAISIYRLANLRASLSGPSDVRVTWDLHIQSDHPGSPTCLLKAYLARSEPS
jgi:hypothetical protein